MPALPRVEVASGNNRVNSNALFKPGDKSVTSNIFTHVLAPAGQPGSSITIALPGSQFYVIYCTAQFFIRPDGGSFNLYSQGTGLQLREGATFENLQAQNPNNFTVLFNLFTGFDAYIDKRLIVNQLQFQPVGHPIIKTVPGAASVAIPDLSGQVFNDINGKAWFAVSRDSIIVANNDAVITYQLQKSGAAIATDDSICSCYPLTTLRFPVSGNYGMAAAAGINAIVSEIYQAIVPPNP